MVRWKSSNKTATDTEIQIVEKELDIRFPQDFVLCVKKNNGGCPEPNVINIKGSGEVFRQLLDFHHDQPMYIVEEAEDLQIEGLSERIIPFANDPFGNYFCFDYRESESNPAIVFYDHETDPDDDMALTYVCDTFTELIESLHEGNS
ncbi:SMI1/KNR4 family protein [Melghirimyces algeriensis]|uniref:SMI1-KNR4 cell-wall n=1 Tax=Melghirimyces algeriensis TaxID=910412 RepID=A0A521CWN5_9BACL|nr:SMI1/KNR4 family protein [Melghirimyces algeriensis]SMO63818.1 SMI1-KNR4 cell-wall [Melghirimyces algeriensis]